MQLRIQSVSELTEVEREQLQQNMVWTEGSRWNENHWYVILEDAAVRISMVVEQITEAMFEVENEVSHV